MFLSLTHFISCTSAFTWLCTRRGAAGHRTRGTRALRDFDELPEERVPFSKSRAGRGRQAFVEGYEEVERPVSRGGRRSRWQEEEVEEIERPVSRAGRSRWEEDELEELPNAAAFGKKDRQRVPTYPMGAKASLAEFYGESSSSSSSSRGKSKGVEKAERKSGDDFLDFPDIDVGRGAKRGGVASADEARGPASRYKFRGQLMQEEGGSSRKASLRGGSLFPESEEVEERGRSFEKKGLERGEGRQRGVEQARGRWNSQHQPKTLVQLQAQVGFVW